MARQRLWTPLSTAILRRAFSSSFHSPATFSVVKTPSHFHSSDNYGLFRADSVRNLELSGKHFLCSQSAEKSDSRCWNCGGAGAGAAPLLVCQSCECVQPVDHSVDYFMIFGLEKKYEIEDENLEGKYKNWQKKLHPDLVHSKSEKEREYSAEQSARVIDAYRTLSKPLSRAIYILKLEGVNVDEEETISENELLAEILEIREAVEEAADTQGLNKIQSEMQEKLKHWSNLFANSFRDRNFGEALKAIRRMTYYQRVQEEIVKRL